MKRSSRWYTLFARLLASFILFTDLTLTASALELGAHELLRARATTLDGVARPGPEQGVAPPHAQTLQQALGSVHFLTGVGGIAFDGIAQPIQGLRVVQLSYRPELCDGQRIRVIIAGPAAGTQEVSAVIYDWQLVPIAKFADSAAYACFTLFGSLESSEEEQSHRRLGHDIMNYHSAFVDSLVGLRLMQADIVFLHPDYCGLPKENGRYLLGAGEQPPDIEANRQKLARLHSFIETLPGGPFQSYVICDYQQEIRFGVKQGLLTLTGNPYWYCWRMKTSDKAKREEIVNLANAEGNRLLDAELDQARAGLSPEAFREKYSEAARRAIFAGYVDREMSARLILPMPEFSRQLSEKIRYLGGVNPTVYDALITTMRYAAFLRYVKKTAPQEYARFMESILRVSPLPQVRTPTVLVPPPKERGATRVE